MQRSSHVELDHGMLAMCGCRREISAQTRLLTRSTILIVASHLVKYTKKHRKSQFDSKPSLLALSARFTIDYKTAAQEKPGDKREKLSLFIFFPRCTRASCTIETLFVVPLTCSQRSYGILGALWHGKCFLIVMNCDTQSVQLTLTNWLNYNWFITSRSLALSPRREPTQLSSRQTRAEIADVLFALGERRRFLRARNFALQKAALSFRFWSELMMRRRQNGDDGVVGAAAWRWCEANASPRG